MDKTTTTTNVSTTPYPNTTNLMNALNAARKNADAAASALNLAISANKYTDIVKKTEELTEAVKEVNKLAVSLFFANLFAKDNPMLAALSTPEVDLIKAKKNTDSNTGIITYTIEPTSQVIDLAAFAAYALERGRGIAANPYFAARVEKFNALASFRVFASLGKDLNAIKRNYYVSEAAAQIDLGKTPTSNTAMLKQLQSVIDGIIFVDNDGVNLYKASSHDVAFIIATMTRHGKDICSVAMPKSETMMKLIVEVLHKIITNKSYAVEYKTTTQATSKDDTATADNTADTTVSADAE